MYMVNTCDWVVVSMCHIGKKSIAVSAFFILHRLIHLYVVAVEHLKKYVKAIEHS